jgi:hypothetical protein
MPKSVPIAIVIAGLIIGGAEIASAWIQRPRYALARLNSTAGLARIDVRSGRIDLCQPDRFTGAGKVAGVQTYGLICVNEQGEQVP